MTAFKTLGAVVFLAGLAAMSARVQAQTQQDRTQDKVAFPAHNPGGVGDGGKEPADNDIAVWLKGDRVHRSVRARPNLECPVQGTIGHQARDPLDVLASHRGEVAADQDSLIRLKEQRANGGVDGQADVWIVNIETGFQGAVRIQASQSRTDAAGCNVEAPADQDLPISLQRESENCSTN